MQKGGHVKMKEDAVEGLQQPGEIKDGWRHLEARRGKEGSLHKTFRGSMALPTP